MTTPNRYTSPDRPPAHLTEPAPSRRRVRTAAVLAAVFLTGWTAGDVLPSPLRWPLIDPCADYDGGAYSGHEIGPVTVWTVVECVGGCGDPNDDIPCTHERMIP